MVVMLGCAREATNLPGGKRTPNKDERMKWWREARFGMFIHWGLYAVPAGQWKDKKDHGEWIMNSAHIPVKDYEQFARQFNPVKFNADKWVQFAQKAGMKYIVITSKHHDGFCLWDSKVTDYDIMDATPLKRDILKELSEACKKQGIRLCFYHSIMDWHHPDAQGPFYPEYNTSQRSNPNFARYAENYMKPQLKELVTNYGPLGVLWFDGEWIPEWTEEQGKDLYKYVRSLQSDIIINNRVGKGRKGMEGLSKSDEDAGDFGTPEQQIPQKGLPGVDWETCMTMNDHWGYCRADENWKSTEDLLQKLVDIASKSGNFLLNVGPTSEGLIPQPSIERLAAMGEWMKVNGESIYGTTASPLGKVPWGRCTAKSGKLYLHIFDWPKDGKLEVAGLKNKVKRAYLLADKKTKLAVARESNETVVINVPEKAPDPIDTVVVLEIKGKPDIAVQGLKQAKDGSVTLRAVDADIHGDTAQYESGDGKDNIGYWTNAQDYVTWDFEVITPGSFNVEITFACEQGIGGSEYSINIAKQQLSETVRETGSWTNFVSEKLGMVKIDKAGTNTLTVRPKNMPRGAVMNLKSITLVPIKE
jgi:alpha-L-fucosidase